VVFATKPQAIGLLVLGLKNLRVDFRVARGIIRELASRQSIFM
jgi:hypothetical protein